MRDDYPSALGPWERLFARRWIVVAVSGGILLAIVGFFLLLRGSSAPTINSGGGPVRVEESGLEPARQSLVRQADLNSCRSALQQINAELREKPERRAPLLKAEQRAWLREQAGLDRGALAEIDGSDYTRLDGHHLDRCLLMRDAAAGLEVKGVRGAGAAEAPLGWAARAFAWVVREIQLGEHGGEPVPPAFALRRGWGSALERALVFLAVLEQFGDPDISRPALLGCLLYIPNESGSMNFWACGVVTDDDKDVYLFDPRLGLPLPGSKGQGIATLAEVRKQPEILAQLNVGDKEALRRDGRTGAGGPRAASLSAVEPVSAHAFLAGTIAGAGGARPSVRGPGEGSGASQGGLRRQADSGGIVEAQRRPTAAFPVAGGGRRR